MTVAAIDADLVCYRAAASAENDPEEIALVRASRTLTDILSVTDASELKLFLSGSSNFRYDIYPEYKANRRDFKRPKWLQQVREYLCIKWGAEVTDGYEADDALGMVSGEGTVICSLDKDLLQLAGNHYNFVTGIFSTISEVDGWRNFYRQCILGDKADNIPGYDGKMRVKFPKFLEKVRQELDGCTTPSDMARLVLELYKYDEQTLIRNGKLLYLWRVQKDQWSVREHLEPTSEVKPVEEVKSASTQMTLVETSPSMGRGGTQPKKGGFPQRGRKKASVSRKTSRGN